MLEFDINNLSLHVCKLVIRLREEYCLGIVWSAVGVNVEALHSITGIDGPGLVERDFLAFHDSFDFFRCISIQALTAVA